MISEILCITCNKAIQGGIYNSTFYPNLLIMSSAFIAVGVVITGFWYVGTKRFKRISSVNTEFLNPLPLMSAGIVLGIGLGGFADGIVLHQILQWHEMVSAKVPPDTLVNKSVNMFWDGIFHAYALLTTLLGVYLLFNVLHRTRVVRAGRLLGGAMLSGWGIFNLIEGLINHQILGLHNVYEYSVHRNLYNWGFLMSGGLLFWSGWLFSRKYLGPAI